MGTCMLGVDDRESDEVRLRALLAAAAVETFQQQFRGLGCLMQPDPPLSRLLAEFDLRQ